ncbi:hypothetical protein YYC_03883 [Plasmodium yoelii 17X]|uniref:PIR protein n=3 Tax=Plasmodium yoelii TaxID=5861 RepID=A0AAF0AYX9_PLAYO|nr:PIR protein [Plasmodium yoelii]ETB58531.1 hypothetical protein YYC_03883 [Plasmodium yoelii 17X]WBY55812.1 PIR protein [Plasmodium yoelii yoelii]CDU16859.1 YIR protein [Plasmodium yoelii]VTZ74544.1 PIR protein [Plasmodium yoelii]|eukprot:XP_022810823.1 PIR protein [Plasmodium yoelii]
MDKRVCKFFYAVRTSLSDKLDNKGNYKFTNERNFNEYCTNSRCSDNLGKVNAGCLFLFDALFKDSSVFKYHNDINMVDYIIIWLSYMLNLKKSEENMSNLQYFYNMYINNNTYKKSITDVAEYNSYKDLVDKANMVNMDMKIISKFYDAFNELCMIYIEFDEQSPNCKNCLKYANGFVEKYKKLKEDTSITKNSSYNKILSSLSTNYDNIKKKCNNFPSLSTIGTANNFVQDSAYSSGQISEDTSSSSIGNKVFIVLSIFAVIPIFLGISYKYSLFGFRKRFKKQQIREKIKNIKKRMNH